jgi:hypothetical protein
MKVPVPRIQYDSVQIRCRGSLLRVIYIALKGLIDKEGSINLRGFYLPIITIINKKIKPIDNIF